MGRCSHPTQLGPSRLWGWPWAVGHVPAVRVPVPACHCPCFQDCIFRRLLPGLGFGDVVAKVTTPVRPCGRGVWCVSGSLCTPMPTVSVELLRREGQRAPPHPARPSGALARPADSGPSGTVRHRAAPCASFPAHRPATCHSAPAPQSGVLVARGSSHTPASSGRGLLQPDSPEKRAAVSVSERTAGALSTSACRVPLSPPFTPGVLASGTEARSPPHSPVSVAGTLSPLACAESHSVCPPATAPCPWALCPQGPSAWQRESDPWLCEPRWAPLCGETTSRRPVQAPGALGVPAPGGRGDAAVTAAADPSQGLQLPGGRRHGAPAPAQPRRARRSPGVGGRPPHGCPFGSPAPPPGQGLAEPPCHGLCVPCGLLLAAGPGHGHPLCADCGSAGTCTDRAPRSPAL